MNNIKSIIFDLDGVLIDSELNYLEVIKSFLESDNINVNIEQLYPLIGVSWDIHYQYLSDLYDNNLSPLEVEKRFSKFEENITYDYKEWLFCDVHITLEELSSKYILALASNTKKSQLLRILNILDLKHYFEVILSSDDVENSKPNPEIYIRAARRLKLNSNECLVVEDSMAGVKSAKSAGMSVVVKNNEYIDISNEVVDYKIDNLIELLTLLKVNGY